jgi:hypothetical protein
MVCHRIAEIGAPDFSSPMVGLLDLLNHLPDFRPCPACHLPAARTVRDTRSAGRASLVGDRAQREVTSLKKLATRLAVAALTGLAAAIATVGPANAGSKWR